MESLEVTAAIHPSVTLRQRTDKDRRAEMERFVGDLRLVAEAPEGP